MENIILEFQTNDEEYWLTLIFMPTLNRYKMEMYTYGKDENPHRVESQLLPSDTTLQRAEWEASLFAAKMERKYKILLSNLFRGDKDETYTSR